MNEYPWQVALVPEWGLSDPFCGGTVINKRFVLTAAHCTEGANANDLKVKVAEHDLSIEADSARVVSVRTIHQHSSYDSHSIDMDFAILELMEEQTFSLTVRPACLPTRDEPYVGVSGKNSLVVSNWILVNYPPFIISCGDWMGKPAILGKLS